MDAGRWHTGGHFPRLKDGVDAGGHRYKPKRSSFSAHRSVSGQVSKCSGEDG